jgi:hypothetical protein
MRGSGIHPPTAAFLPSPIHAKFSDPRKLRKALCERDFNSYTLKIHPHDLQMSPNILLRRVRFEALPRFAEQFGEVHRFGVERNPASFDFGQIEHVVDQAEQMAGAGQYIGQIVFLFFGN